MVSDWQKAWGSQTQSPIYQTGQDCRPPNLEQCKRFVIDSNANSKGALFMWKMKQLTSNTKKM